MWVELCYSDGLVQALKDRKLGSPGHRLEQKARGCFILHALKADIRSVDAKRSSIRGCTAGRQVASELCVCWPTTRLRPQPVVQSPLAHQIVRPGLYRLEKPQRPVGGSGHHDSPGDAIRRTAGLVRRNIRFQRRHVPFIPRDPPYRPMMSEHDCHAASIDHVPS
jgi:hypothetical protein